MRRELKRRFPDEDLKGTTFYAFMRALQLRFLRLPKPRVKMGQTLPERYWVELENGDRWLLKLEGNERTPKPAAEVTIRRGALSNWWVKVKGGQTFQARFLGQPD